MGLGREGNALGQRSGVLAEQLVQRLRIGFRVEFHLPFFDNLRGVSFLAPHGILD